MRVGQKLAWKWTCRVALLLPAIVGMATHTPHGPSGDVLATSRTGRPRRG